MGVWSGAPAEAPLRLRAVEWERGSDIDRVVVLCDRFRRYGLAFIVGKMVFIDGVPFTVHGADAEHMAGPMNRGDRVTLWVESVIADNTRETSHG